MVQLQVLNKIIKSGSLDIIFKNDITSEYFGEYETEYNFINNHFHQYGNVPDMETMLDKFPEFDVLDVEESDSYLIDTLREEYKYRLMVPILNKSAELMKSDANAAADYIKSSIPQIEIDAMNIGTSIVLESDLRFSEYDDKKNATTPWLRPTGFKELDDEIGGLAPKEEFVVIVARTNQGKSWILCKMAEHNWKFGANVGYISPEMSANAIGYRFDTLHAHFSNFDLFNGREVEGYQDYIDSLKKNAKNDFIVATPLDFKKRITISKLRNFCISHKFDILFIDGITYISDERYKKGDNKTTSLTNISEDLMSLSCELGIPIVVVVQANRSGVDDNGGAPSLESIRDSDGIAHNATKVLSIRQKDGRLKIEVVKARNCRVGAKLLYNWDIDKGTFEFEASGEAVNEISETQQNNSNSDRYTNKKYSEVLVENKQPIRRQVSSNPF